MSWVHPIIIFKKENSLSDNFVQKLLAQGPPRAQFLRQWKTRKDTPYLGVFRLKIRLKKQNFLKKFFSAHNFLEQLLIARDGLGFAA